MAMASVVFEGFNGGGIAGIVSGGFLTGATVDDYTPNPLYDQLAATALQLIRDYGRPMVLMRNVESFNPVTGSVSTASTEQLNTNGIMGTLTSGYTTELMAVGVTVRTGDRLVTIDATTAPRLTDVLKIGTQRWTIVNIDEMNPAGIPLVYKLLVRQ